MKRTEFFGKSLVPFQLAVMARAPRANVFQLTDLLAKEALMLLRNRTIAIQTFDRSFEGYFTGQEKVGDTIRVKRRVIPTPSDFTSTISVQDIKQTNIPLVLDFHKDISHQLTQKDVALNLNDFSETVVAPAMIGMVEAIEQNLLTKYKHLATAAGASASAPGALPTTLGDVASMVETLENQKVPTTGRIGVLSPSAQTAYLSIANLVTANTRGDGGRALREALVGRVMGFEHYMTQNIDNSTFTSGTMTSCVVNGALAAGATSIVFDGASGATHTLKKYDIITIAGYGNVVVAANVTASSSAGTITLMEPLREAVADDVAITVYDGGGNTRKLQGAYYHPSAFAFFSVPMDVPPGMNGSVASDPVTGLSVRILMQGDITSKSSIISFDVLGGSKCIDPRLGAQIIQNI